MANVTSEDIRKAAALLGVEIPDSLIKGMESKELEGSKNNGGGSEDNSLKEKGEMIKSQIKKSEDNLAALKEKTDKEEEKKKKWMAAKDKVEKGEDPGELKEDEDEPEEKKDKVEKSAEVKELEKQVAAQSTLLKSFSNQFATLNEAIGKLNQPEDRRSAEGLQSLMKSLGIEPIEGTGAGEGEQKLNPRIHKSQISDALFAAYTETKDGKYADAVGVFEASGYLDASVKTLLKGRGVEIL